MASKRVMLTLSEILLSEVDYLTAVENRNRSEIMREALNYYLGERKREMRIEQMKQGYMEMAPINLTLACEIPGLEDDFWNCMHLNYWRKRTYD